MKVQTKILLLLLAMVVLFSGGLAVLQVAERRQFKKIADDRAIERNQLFDKFLSERGDNLSVLVEDSTVWDDMVRAVVKKDRAWVEEHVSDETLTTYQANAVWVYGTDGKLLFSRNNRYAANLQEVPIPAEAIPTSLAGKNHLCHFFCKVPQGWMEVRGATVHPSRDPLRETTPQGYFFAGHIWIEENIRQMAAFTGYNIRITSAKLNLPPQASEEDRGLIAFSRVLNGWDGRPTAQILVQHDSPIIRELNRASERLLLGLVAFAAGFCLLISLSLILWVRRPLRMISSSLRERNLAALRPLREERNEFGDLAKLIVHSRETEHELERTEELLRHAQKLEAVGRLAGGVAHDFNNLLTAIIGYAEMLEMKLEEGNHREQASLIRKAGEQAASLTRQLLAFSRKQLLQPVVLDLNELILDMKKLLQRVIGEHILIQINPGAENARVRADRSQLEQVILNLGVNARDAMPGGGSLMITTREKMLADCESVDDGSELAPGWYVQLCVCDSGSGMDSETKARIFEPFFTTKGPGKGTGLGLATVYGIVKQSGGGISVESTPGEGSTFCIYLPREESAVEAIVPPVARPEPARNVETILVLEDEEVVRDLVCAVLGDSGFRVLCAGSPGEAIALVERHSGSIDLLVSDVILPEMHGPVIARKLLAIQPTMKVLFVSGYSENDISDQGVVEPGVEVLQKPFSQQGLVRKVREMLDLPSGPLP